MSFNPIEAFKGLSTAKKILAVAAPATLFAPAIIDGFKKFLAGGAQSSTAAKMACPGLAIADALVPNPQGQAAPAQAPQGTPQV